MPPNIRVLFSEEAEASALAPMEIEINNDEPLPCAFKLALMHPNRYITNSSHGIILPKHSKKILLRLKAPNELKETPPAPVVSILKAAGNKTAPRGEGPNSAITSVEVAKLDLRVITSVLPSHTTEAEFQRYWKTAFRDEGLSHTIPFKAVFLSEEEFFSELLQRQEDGLKEAEAERAHLQASVASLKVESVTIDDRNRAFTKDLDKLRARAQAVISNNARLSHRVVVPTLIGIAAVLASISSAATIAFDI